MFEQLPERVKIVEVGPRDGLQNEARSIETADKLSFIHKLVAAGIDCIEATSFVRPDRVPQMADGAQLFPQLLQTSALSAANFPVLVPNLKGLENALNAGATHFALLTATSETFSQKNMNVTVKKSLQSISQMIGRLGEREGQYQVRVYISTAFGCPYQGEVTSRQLLEVIEGILAVEGEGSTRRPAIAEIALGDTIGVATPMQVDALLRELAKVVELSRVALHFHNTRGMALANILVGLERGVRIYDASAGGLGGCPYARGATGNVGTEDVVYLMDSLGVATGVDLAGVASASAWILEKIQRQSTSFVHNALEKQGIFTN